MHLFWAACKRIFNFLFIFGYQAYERNGGSLYCIIIFVKENWGTYFGDRGILSWNLFYLWHEWAWILLKGFHQRYNLSMSKILVPQWIMKYSTDAGKVMLYARHKTYCILSPLIPKFRVRKGKKNLSNISLHLSKFAIIESLNNTNFALVDDVDMVTSFLKVLYQPNLPFLANGLIWIDQRIHF